MQIYSVGCCRAVLKAESFQLAEVRDRLLITVTWIKSRFRYCNDLPRPPHLPLLGIEINVLNNIISCCF